jgi:hypothetical protein
MHARQTFPLKLLTAAVALLCCINEPAFGAGEGGGGRGALAANRTVTNTNDSGAGSLRDAINAVTSGETITFSNSTANGATNFYDTTAHKITLTSGELGMAKNLTINGPGANVLAISGNNQSRVFRVDGGSVVNLGGLTVTGGNVNGDSGGGGIRNYGILTVTNCAISGNSTNSAGGGIANNNGGTLTVTNSTISGNSGQSGGGGIYNDFATLTVTNCTVSGNSSGDGGGINSYGTATVTNSTISGNSSSNSTPSGHQPCS